MTVPEKMSGVQLIGHGDADMLVWNEAIPVPSPGHGQALVKILAAGVNNTDINTRVGWYSKDVTGATDSVDAADDGGWSGALNFPLIQGGDLCGRIVALGKGADGLSIGQRVTCPINQPKPTADAPTRFEALGSEYDGTFAQYCLVDANQLFDVSTSPLSDIEIGAMPCAYGTAYNLLRRPEMTSGDHVLITGASGGVGLAAVQLAKVLGAEVTGITSSAKADAVRGAGADHILMRDDTPAAQSYSAVVDVVGGDNWGALIDALKPGGRYAVSGAIAGPIVESDLRTIYLNDLTLFGCSYQPIEIFGELVDLINQGQVRPLVSKTYPLRDIAQAQTDFITKTYPGKLVLIP